MGTVRANSAIMKDHRLGNELWANNSESESWLFSSRTSPSSELETLSGKLKSSWLTSAMKVSLKVACGSRL